MKHDQNICFVIMGFGRKKDPSTNRTIDLDETYKKIIRPAVLACNYNCVRADEISESGIIDRSMYALLMHAELVIADISTYNPNALYELGIRHAVRPYSTIILKEDEGTLPFDISHNRTLKYKHPGTEISATEAMKSIRELKTLITSVTNSPTTDSPLYTFIPRIVQPLLSEEDYSQIIGALRSTENTIYSLMERAREYMSHNRFADAAMKWKQLSEMAENELFFVQQHALCTYKSKEPDALVALTNALTIINKLHPANDAETLGITGAIYKNLWKSTSNPGFLDLAIDAYKKGWHLHNDYYTAENYAHCLEQKSVQESEPEDKIYYKVEAKHTRKKIIEILSTPEAGDEGNEDKKWKYATLSNCYLATEDGNNAVLYEGKFLATHPQQWEIDTFTVSKNELITLSKNK